MGRFNGNPYSETRDINQTEKGHRAFMENTTSTFVAITVVLQT